MQCNGSGGVKISKCLIGPDWGKDNDIIYHTHAFRGILCAIYRILGGEGSPACRGHNGGQAPAQPSRDYAE